YGSQFDEISKQGKDGNKGRLNGNLFLSAMIIVCLFTIIILMYALIPEMDMQFNRFMRKISGGGSGKAIGKLLAIPLLALVYWIISRTIGSEQNFQKHVKNFLAYPDEIKKKANAKTLIPFFVLLITFFILLVVN